jgi:siderophore-mediated iron transport protein
MTTKTKFVDVTCRQPIRLRNKIVRAIYHENLTTQEIADCISQHAVVEEILPTGAKVVLDFTNYDKFEAPKTETKPAPKKEAKPAKEEVKEEQPKEETKPAKEEKPVVAPVKEEEVVEDADQKVEEAKKATKEKK